jgi:hypothetical protein
MLYCIYFFVVALYLCFLHSCKNVPKHIILYFYCISLLIWSSTQLNFSFYDFSVIHYEFLKLS